MRFPRLKGLSLIAIILQGLANLIRQWPWIALAGVHCGTAQHRTASQMGV